MEKKSSTMGERIRRVRGHEKRKDFAEKYQVHPNTLDSWEGDKTNPPLNFITQLIQNTGVQWEWLVFGTGPMLRGRMGMTTSLSEADDAPQPNAIPEEHPPYEVPDPDPSPSLKMVPRVAARLSAGNGRLETDDDVIGHYAFREDWLHSKGNPDSMVLMQITGESMEPALQDKDLVLIDQSKKEIISGGIYAVGIDNAVIVKEVHNHPGKLILSSINGNFQNIDIDLNDESLNFRVVGRVIWVCRELV